MEYRLPLLERKQILAIAVVTDIAINSREVIVSGVLWSLEIPHQGEWHRASLSRSPDSNLWRGCGFPCRCPGPVALEAGDVLIVTRLDRLARST